MSAVPTKYPQWTQEQWERAARAMDAYNAELLAAIEMMDQSAALRIDARFKAEQAGHRFSHVLFELCVKEPEAEEDMG